MSDTTEPGYIKFYCTECRRKLKVKEEHIGKTVQCPKCQLQLTVPAQTEEEPVPKEGVSEEPQESPVRAPTAVVNVSSERKSTRGWRRTWKTADPSQRQAAAESLDDLFVRPKRSMALLILLILSLAAHGGMAPFMLKAATTDMKALVEKDSNHQKVMQKQRSKEISKEVMDRTTMPPPPPDPEKAIEESLSATITEDVEKVVKDVVEDVMLLDQMKDRIKTAFADELKKAAENMVKDKMSEAELEKLQETYRKKAHQVALETLKDYMVEHQEETAELSTTEWYEQKVSSVLFRNMKYVLFFIQHNENKVWFRAYQGGYKGMFPRWHDVTAAYRNIGNKVSALEGLITGKWRHAGGRNVHKHPAWSGEPSENQAKVIIERLNVLYKGKNERRNMHPSWKSCVFGGTARPYYTYGILEELYPHRVDEMKPKYEAIDPVWQKTIESAELYMEKAEEGAEEAELKKAQQECLQAITDLAKMIRAVLPGKGWAENASRANTALRYDIVNRDKEKVFNYWKKTMVNGLAPLIKDFARGQFKKGIIKHKAGVDQAMKEFSEALIPLVTRDLVKMFPKKIFYERVFEPYIYRSKVTGHGRGPKESEIKKLVVDMEKSVASWSEKDKAYINVRRKQVEKYFQEGIDHVKEELLTLVLTGGLLLKQMGTFVEGVDYSNKVEEKLDARKRAMEGRGQDLADLTQDGVPDTSALQVALKFSAKGGGGVHPVVAGPIPGFYLNKIPERAIASIHPVYPPVPAKWGFVEQYKPKPSFKTHAVDGIPFLPKFPSIDGDLRDWGKVRPLTLRHGKGKDSILVYAGWNYHGFFFGYDFKIPKELIFYPQASRRNPANAATGEHFQLVFDTLDARNKVRGEPHTQEFIILPIGTDTVPESPGVERIIASQRAGSRKEYRRVQAQLKMYPHQPPADHGPDGSGPFRVTRTRWNVSRDQQGYTVEVFIPRTIFKTPVFAPGWYIGFDCAVAGAFQGRHGRTGTKKSWAGMRPDEPIRWGDLMLLGTDARVLVQNADKEGTLAYGVIPGHSYLLTVLDPDRNVNIATKDTILVSAEVALKGGEGARDVEVFILNETKANSGIFRGYVDTQPGEGGKVLGVLETMTGEQIHFGYVDFANAKGIRKVVNKVKLPVVAPLMRKPKVIKETVNSDQ
jgi:hypothetical protein